ncbi:hypothetical protein D7V91_17605 [bacterium 1xD42-67]|nr:hypothetical protein D7V91_17605 [bacterium 1xD42-67]
MKGSEAALAEFYSQNPTDVSTKPNGTIVGTLADGRTINVHPASSLKGVPTVEIYDPTTKTSAL